MGFYEGKRVLLVGGSEGIGRAVAVRLAAEGANVCVTARRVEPLEQAVRDMERARRSGDQHVFFRAFDATNRDAVRQNVASVAETLGGLDVVITNLGAANPGYVRDLTDDDFDRMLAVNTTAHVNVIRAALPLLIASRGAVCMVSSALGFMSIPGYAAYSASKFAVVGFAESLRMELASDGVRVCVFFPGTTNTPGLQKENDSKPAAVWAMEADSSFSKTHEPESVAASMLRTIESDRFMGFPGFDVSLIWWLYTRFPRLSRWIADREWAAALRKVDKESPSE